MKFFLLFIFLSVNYANASEDLFELQSFSYSMENDSPVDTDYSYTHGARASFLYYRGNTKDSLLNIPFSDYKNTNNFISFAYANQMYTPAKLDKIYPIRDDRPYAGYSYIELGLHQTTDTTLDSLTIETGFIGPSTDMDFLQSFIHELIDTKKVCGWDYQLENQYIFQLNYMHKDRIKYEDISDYENDLITYYGLNLGNKSIKASSGALYRVGFNISDDFGANSMHEGSHSSMPVKPKSFLNSKTDSSFFLNLSAGANLIASDIFLDGKTVKNYSHSVDRNFFTAYVMAGITYRYKQYKIDFFHNYYSEDYKQRSSYRTYRGYSSLIFTYSFK